MSKIHDIVVFHNPGAGDAAHAREDLTSLLKGEGYKVSYYSTKENWQEASIENADLVVIAGGDGTVRKIAEWMIKNKLIVLKKTLTILPLGTANNLSKTLRIKGEVHELIAAWKNWTIQPYDIGRAAGELFFMEAMGLGLFVDHLHRGKMLKGRTAHEDDPEKKIKADLERLRVTLKDMRSFEASVTIDGEIVVDNFLLVEIMNSRHLGTNLDLNPGNKSGDGKFQVVLVNESEKDLLDEFIIEHIRDMNRRIQFTTIHGNSISINSLNTFYHLDDELYKLEGGGEVNIAADDQQLFFLAP